MRHFSLLKDKTLGVALDIKTLRRRPKPCQSDISLWKPLVDCQDTVSLRMIPHKVNMRAKNRTRHGRKSVLMIFILLAR